MAPRMRTRGSVHPQWLAPERRRAAVATVRAELRSSSRRQAAERRRAAVLPLMEHGLSQSVAYAVAVGAELLDGGERSR